MIIKENNQYTLELEQDGIYLYRKVEQLDAVSDKLSGLKIDDRGSGKDNKKSEKKLLQKITLVGSSYELLFAIVDAIVNRSLQREFSFEKDIYAKNLRIIFGLLVPKFNMKYSLVYIRDDLKVSTTMELAVKGFMGIKRLLDNDKSTAQEKRAFLNIDTLVGLDEALVQALENYHSEDSDTDGEKSEEEEDSSLPNRFRYSIEKNPKKEMIKASVNKFNAFLQKRDPETQHLEVVDRKIKIDAEVLPVEFVIPGFRGVNHMPLRFSDEARRLYRSKAFQDRRAEIPYYSEAALMSRFDFYRDTNGAQQHLLNDREDNANYIALNKNAEELEQDLLKLRNENYILAKTLSNGSVDDVRLFSNTLYFLQHLYSNGIIKSQRLLFEDLKQKFPLFRKLSAYNPFVSESESSEHALRYSCGQKVLYLPAALHPHYDKNGKPSFPYIGEIFISIRDASVFAGNRERHQLRRLEAKRRVNPSLYIGPELESTGFSWLHKGEVVFSEVVKCPSFSGHWKNIYREKYSLNKAMFKSFQKRFRQSKSKEMRAVIENDVVEYLNKYYSDRLLKRAVEYAGKDRTLVFLKSDGTLNFTLPRRDASADFDETAETVRTSIERALYQYVKGKSKSPKIAVKLTSKEMKVYSLTPQEVKTELEKLKKGKTKKEQSDYKQFFWDDERMRTPLNAKSSPRTSSGSSRSSSSQVSFSGSPGTPLGEHRYIDYNDKAENQEEFPLPKKVLFKSPEEEYSDCLEKQQELKMALNLGLTDYEILQKFSQLSPKVPSYDKKNKLFDLTLELMMYHQELLKHQYRIEDTESSEQDEQREWSVIVDNKIYIFDEEEVEGDGWCLLNSIDIEPEEAINLLFKKLEEDSIEPELKDFLFKAIYDNYLAKALGEEFLTDEEDDDDNIILNVANDFQQKINTAQTQAHTRAHVALMNYLSRNDVLRAYLLYIKETKYVNEHLGAAFSYCFDKKLVSFQNHKNNGELYCNSSSFDVNDPTVQFVIFHPGANAATSHYNKLVYNSEKTLERRATKVKTDLEDVFQPILKKQEKVKVSEPKVVTPLRLHKAEEEKTKSSESATDKKKLIVKRK